MEIEQTVDTNDLGSVPKLYFEDISKTEGVRFEIIDNKTYISAVDFVKLMTGKENAHNCVDEARKKIETRKDEMAGLWTTFQFKGMCILM